MVDITHKPFTLRKAIATSILKVSKYETIEAILQKRIAKGDVFEFGRAAGFLGIKKTHELIPDCHPLPIEKATINYQINNLEINIIVEVQTIYRTGVEVEAMHGASIVALTIYDMLKPIDKGIEISNIRLVEKKGGKSDFNDQSGENINAAIVVCSDSISLGNKKDEAGLSIKEQLESYGVSITDYQIIPDEIEKIQQTAKDLSSINNHFVLFIGGTGLSDRDLTPESIIPLIERPVPGIIEATRHYGQMKTPYSMLSRGVSGFIKETLVITLPGSLKGSKESMEAIFPYFLHIFRVSKGYDHSKK